MTTPEGVSSTRDKNVAHLLRIAAERWPSRTAIVERERAVSYAELWRRATVMGGALRDRGVREGDRVGIFLERGADAAAAYFGTVGCGAIAVVINDRLRARQLEHVLRDSSPRVLVTSPEMLAKQQRPIDLPLDVADVADLVGGTGGGPPRVATRAGADPVQIIYTSGSTGLPKGVTLGHGAVNEGMRVVSGYLGLGAEDRVASLMPFSSVYGFNQLLCSVGVGATLVVERSPLPHQIVSAMQAQAVTVLAAVPPLWIQLLGVPTFRAGAIPTLRILQNAGGHLPVPVVRRLREAQPLARLFLQYGQTETFRGTFLPPEEVDRRPDSMGRGIPGAEILVLRDDLTPAPPGEVGELVHCGPTVALGYWNNREATERVFRPHPLRSGDPAGPRAVFSGDLVRADQEGFLYYVGRRDKMIKTLGYRVGPDEVLDVLHASGQISEAVVAGEPDEQRGERIVAYVVLAEGGTAERLEAFCRMEMPRHMVPARFEVRTALPRTAAGKYDLQAFATPTSPLAVPA